MNVAIAMLKKFYTSVFLTSLLLTGMLVAVNKEALADYQPPPKKEDKEEKHTSANISRGCPTIYEETNELTIQAKTGLVALAPQVHHTGKTTLTHPTFVWYVPDVKPYQVSLELYQRQPEGKPQSVWNWESTTKQGIMSVSLPETQPPLEAGQQYYWQVRVQCDPAHPTSWLIAEANLEVVATPADLASQLAQAPNSIAKADIYADAGIWYEALAIAITNSNSDRMDLQLLASLAEIEAQEEGIEQIQDPKELDKTYSYRLNKVIEAERQKTISYRIDSMSDNQ